MKKSQGLRPQLTEAEGLLLRHLQSDVSSKPERGDDFGVDREWYADFPGWRRLIEKDAIVDIWRVLKW